MRKTEFLAFVMILLVISMPICFSAQYSLTYDANGNLVTGDGNYRIYNSLNQLWKIYNGTNTSGVLLESYQYHPTEERVHIKTVYNSTGGVKETTYYVSKSFVQVVNATGEYNYTYVYQNGQLVAQNMNGVKTFIITDNLGSATVVTNSTGSVIENTSYSPFGEIITGGDKTRYDYTGQEFDSVSGDYDYNARRYKASIGKFITPDTQIQNIYNPKDLNHYSYARNNPYFYVDTGGHRVETRVEQINGEDIVGIYVNGIYEGRVIDETQETKIMTTPWGTSITMTYYDYEVQPGSRNRGGSGTYTKTSYDTKAPTKHLSTVAMNDERSITKEQNVEIAVSVASNVLSATNVLKGTGVLSSSSTNVLKTLDRIDKTKTSYDVSKEILAKKDYLEIIKAAAGFVPILNTCVLISTQNQGYSSYSKIPQFQSIYKKI